MSSIEMFTFRFYYIVRWCIYIRVFTNYFSKNKDDEKIKKEERGKERKKEGKKERTIETWLNNSK
ncbi:hypothetical protein GQ42DRAFT_12916 [Ramicandelaber brevisporus]|nr:hypothetical protein GQ42DRAFT_12916 [Ramicandelaber brevisporus]